MADKINFVSDDDVATVERGSRRQTRAVSRATAAKNPHHQHKLRSDRKCAPKLRLDDGHKDDKKAKHSNRKPSAARGKAVENDDDHCSGYNSNHDDDDDGSDGDNDDKDNEGNSSDESNDDDDNDDDYSDDEKLITATALGNEAALRGHDVFGFQTPRRSGSLAQAAAEAVHVQKGKTPKSSKKPTGGTSKSNTKNNATRKRNRGNQSSEEKQANEEIKTKSGRRSVARIPVVTARVLEDSDEELSEASSDEESEKLQSEDPSEMVQEYFTAHHSTKCLTSDRTLASLGNLMDQEELSRHLQQVSATHHDETVKLYSQYRKHFAKWIFQIRHGFNLLLYGLGSKRVLIDQFRTSMLQGMTQLVVNGFFPSITIKHILNTITEEVLEHDGTFKSIIDQTSFIKDMFTKGKGPGNLYLIIHNIDGPMLRSKKTQTVLSLLAETPYIHLIASIDHINAPLVWDQSMCSRYRWLWNDVSTFEPYVEETSYENSLLVQHSGALALSSMTHVMRSLTPNGREIFLIIVKQQLAEKDNSSYIGFSIHDLYTKCREAFLVNSEQTLRAQLTEFRDHKLIRSRKGPDGVEYLHVPLDNSTLKQFIEEHGSSNK